MSGIAGSVAIQAANAYFDARASEVFSAAQSKNFQAYVEEIPIDGTSLSINSLGPNPIVEEMTGSQRFTALRALSRMKAVVPYAQRALEFTATQIEGDKIGLISRAIDNYLAAAASFMWKPVVDLLGTNPVGIDGVSILNDTHPFGSGATTWDNLVTTAFSPAALNTGVVAMTSLKTEAGMPFGIRPTHLMVEPTNERDAKDAIGVNRPMPVSTAGVVNAASANIAAVYGENWLRGELVLIVEPLLARTTDWFLMDLSKPGVRPMVAGVQGPVESVITMKDSQPYMQRDVIQYALRQRAALSGFVPQCIYGRNA